MRALFRRIADHMDDDGGFALELTLTNGQVIVANDWIAFDDFIEVIGYDTRHDAGNTFIPNHAIAKVTPRIRQQ